MNHRLLDMVASNQIDECINLINVEHADPQRPGLALDVNYCHSHALTIACKRGYYPMVEFLLFHGAHVHSNDESALRVAARYGHTDVVRLLLRLDADIHARDDEALRSSAFNGHVKCVRLLLKHGADIHSQYNDALVVAAEGGHVDVVELLLNHGADVTDSYALGCASRNRHIEVCMALMVRGMDPSVCSRYVMREIRRREQRLKTLMTSVLNIRHVGDIVLMYAGMITLKTNM